LSVGLIVITHGATGQSLIDAGEFILGRDLDAIRVIAFEQSGAARTDAEDIQAAARAVDQGDGILVLTDLLGASPCNVVTSTMSGYHAQAVTGLNLAMLIRVWNYRDRPLEELARIAAEGGRRGVEIVKS
jgi:PTS system ascorbate-specific IIA component